MRIVDQPPDRMTNFQCLSFAAEHGMLREHSMTAKLHDTTGR
jgi:hypothetical protein